MIARTPVLNLAVVGQVRSGSSVIQSAVNAHPEAVCYEELLHPDERVRQELHNGYFEHDPKYPCWFGASERSAEQYLDGYVFDRPTCDERLVGVKLTYPQLHQLDLWDYLRERTLAGDFCTIHVRRNPVACYVSYKQAMAVVAGGDLEEAFNPSPVFGEREELIRFVRAQAAWEVKLASCCDDRLEIDYQELFLSYPEVMRGVFRYLGLPPARVKPASRRAKNRNVPERLWNFAELREAVPRDVREFFEAPDLF